MRFQEVYEGWRERRLSQSEAAEILGVCERSFRRYSARYEDSEGDLNSLAGIVNLTPPVLQADRMQPMKKKAKGHTDKNTAISYTATGCRRDELATVSKVARA